MAGDPHRARGETAMGGPDIAFQPTEWSAVRAAGGAGPGAGEALERLLLACWKPLYFHIRRKGHGVEDAKDLTQQFIIKVLERGVLAQADREKGRFRTFLLAVLDRFLCDEHDRKMALKRRPDLDAREAETAFQPASSFERDWALAVLERGFVLLAEEAPREARVVRAQGRDGRRLKEVATELGISEGNAKVLAHRGRKRLREIILAELRAAAIGPGGEEEGLRDLFRAIAL